MFRTINRMLTRSPARLVGVVLDVPEDRVTTDGQLRVTTSNIVRTVA